MKYTLCALAFVLLAACGGEPMLNAPQGSITEVVVVLKGSSQPLPFDPRGGRLTIVTQEITKLIGHPIVLELDTALSPEQKASLEETVLASFEVVVKDLVFLQKEDPEMFEQARALTRIVCHYDAVLKRSDGEVESSGKILSVTSPPDRFPLLERGILADAVYSAHVEALDKRWGNLDPAQLSSGQQAPYFAYMMTTRPGASYLWIAARAGNRGADWDSLRVEHFKRIIRLSNAVEPRSELGAKVRRFLADDVGYAASTPSLANDYAAWLTTNWPLFDDKENVKLAETVFRRKGEGKLAGFDRFAYGMAIYDRWAGGSVHGELEKVVVCPSKRRGEAETEIKWSCSRFFESIYGDDADRARLADTIVKRNEDHRLLEIALLNIGHDEGPHAVLLVESLASHPSLFHDGVLLLFHDNARRDDVKSALDGAFPRWWRDMPTQRGLSLLIMGRRWEGLDPHYADNQWTRFTAEFGGPVNRDVLSAFLAEGPRAVEMAPLMWLAFAKNPDRDDAVAHALPTLLDRPKSPTAPLTLLRRRLCDEKNASGLTRMHDVIEAWASGHPDQRATVSNALSDFTLARCIGSIP